MTVSERDRTAQAFLFETGMFDSSTEVAANPDHPLVLAAYRAADRLTAALSDQGGGWQPIETAPKRNRVYVDLYFPQREAGEYGRVPDCQYLPNETTPGWYAWNEEADAFYYIGDRATHWMYRPESPPPSSPAGEG